MRIQIRVQVFARLREHLGGDEVTVSLPEPATVAAIRVALGEQLPKELTNLVRVSAVALNGEYAADDVRVASTDEVALIPPVSGGQS